MSDTSLIPFVIGVEGGPDIYIRCVSAADPTGIYGIFNSVDGKVNVGSSVHMTTRWKEHRDALNKGVHGNPHLQAAWNKYGAAAFEFREIERCSYESLVAREDYWIAYHHSLDSRFGYNLQNASQTIITDALRASHSKAQKGIRKTPIWRKRIGEAQKWRTMDAAHREHLRILNTGKVQSAESNEKRRKTQTGKPKPVGFGAKVSAALKGRRLTEERKQKNRHPHKKKGETV